MNFEDVLLKKRNGGELSRDEINYFVESPGNGIEDYKISAFLMCVYFNGMTASETYYLTEAIARSGEMNDLSRFGNLSADKHSTGGVGDKTTLIVAPIAAAAGCKIAKMSGRGLGDTGGTVDKLESIPGFRVTLSPEDFEKQTEDIGIAVVGQSGDLAPADKKLYALRDVTCTVDSIPLIASSIMSKKLAAGAKNIVLDVKYGSGAFMKSRDEADLLANAMVDIGRKHGRKVTAVISDMNEPLGYTAGNSLEVAEAVEVLRGGRSDGRLVEICCALAAEMIASALSLKTEDAYARAEKILSDGSAYKVFREWIKRQGGDVRFTDDCSLLPLSQPVYSIKAQRDGYITGISAAAAGRICRLSGAGRQSKGDPIDYGAGIRFLKKTGEHVTKGEVTAVVYSEDKTKISLFADEAVNMIEIGETKKAESPIIYKIKR